MTVTDRPRVALAALRDLRTLLDTLLPSFSHTEVGERYGKTGATFWNRWSRVRQ